MTRVRAKVNIILDGKKYNTGDEFEVNEKQLDRLGSLVDVIEKKKEATFEDKVIKPEEAVERKAVKKGRKSKKDS